MDSRDLGDYSTPCPREPDSECDEEQPDPPDIPDPPEPECGDREVRLTDQSEISMRLTDQSQVSEPGEECDCGESWAECEDPCCYPAT